jgi:hypothetical protein
MNFLIDQPACASIQRLALDAFHRAVEGDEPVPLDRGQPGDCPAASMAFWLASEIMPASATAVTSGSR